MFDLITFLGSYVLSFITTLTAKRMEHAAQQQRQLLQLAGLREDSTRTARTQLRDRHSKTTRRVLALTMNASFAALALGLGVAWLGLPVFVEVQETARGFWPFVADKDTTRFVELNGAVILQEYRLIILSVFGLYFGNNHAR